MTGPVIDFTILDGLGIERQRFDAGERIFLQDDPATHMYAVYSGKVQVITFGTVLENVGPGGLFGEMAMIDDGPRSAAALAAEPAEVALIDQKMFLQLVKQHPDFALGVMRLLASRIRRMNANI
jgi:CRP/FNR family transcriptional regulator, cyclic AMP receptor protein